eukprot:gene17749-biopygen12908
MRACFPRARFRARVFVRARCFTQAFVHARVPLRPAFLRALLLRNPTETLLLAVVGSHKPLDLHVARRIGAKVVLRSGRGARSSRTQMDLPWISRPLPGALHKSTVVVVPQNKYGARACWFPENRDSRSKDFTPASRCNSGARSFARAPPSFVFRYALRVTRKAQEP